MESHFIAWRLWSYQRKQNESKGRHRRLIFATFHGEHVTHHRKTGREVVTSWKALYIRHKRSPM